MIFEQIATGGCQSYLVGCPEACAGVLIDPELRQRRARWRSSCMSFLYASRVDLLEQSRADEPRDRG